MIVLLTISICLALAAGEQENPKPSNDTTAQDGYNFCIKLSEKIKSEHATWKAVECSNINSELKYFLGPLNNSNDRVLSMKNSTSDKNSRMPRTFDLRKEYTNCTSIFSVLEQSNCNSSWVIASTNAFSDRICIASKGEKNAKISPETPLACCKSCGGGYINEIWIYFKKEGGITGGEYNSSEDCQPSYPIMPCGRAGQSKCPSDMPEMACNAFCANPNYSSPHGTVYKNKFYKFKIHFRILSAFATNITIRSFSLVESAYALKPNTKEIQREIMTSGSVVASFKVYEDFFLYKSGIYQYTRGKSKGRHAVRVIGWGEENRVPYWLAVNSWGKKWGENGTFKIRRGNNECGFEKRMVAGEPKI